MSDPSLVSPTITAVTPLLAVPGGRVTLHGGPFLSDGGRLPAVRVGAHRARVALAASRQLTFWLPDDVEGGRTPVRIDEAPGAAVLLDVGTRIATGIHQVDNPAIDADGNVYLTCSGSRGQRTAVSVYRVSEAGVREVFVTGLTNATSLAIGPDNHLFVSSRFDGTVSRIGSDGRAHVVAADLGVACGVVFGPDGSMFVGDRSGCVFRVDASGTASLLAPIPPSIAAFHLAAAPDGAVLVAAPTLSSRDAVYRVSPEGAVSVLATAFGRPQGLAFGPDASLYVVEALAGVCGLYRLGGGSEPELVLAAPSLVGVAFDPRGGLVVASGDTAWRFPGVRPGGPIG